MSGINPAEGLSEKAAKALIIMASSGTYEGAMVAETLNTIAENGDDGHTNQASNEHLLACAKEIAHWANAFIEHVEAKPAIMERSKNTTYWWKCEAFTGDMPEPLVEALDEAASERIREMTDEGYTSGELIAHIHVEIPGHETPDDGFYCHGWWDVDKNS